MQVINTNILSLNSQRNLGTSGNSLATSIQRLSSGLRINSAKDDAAGLAISERFTTQIRGLNQATRNANDGISLAQTAEGALSEVSNNLQRVRELAVQSRNATNSASDRLALDAEVQERIKEINRVASQTEFNGLKLLDGSFAGSVFQVGANFGQTIGITDIANATGTALGLAGGTLQQFTATGTTVQAGFGAGDLTINGTAVTASADAKAIADAINALGQFGTTATATNTQSVNFADVIGSAGVAATPANTGPSGAYTAAVSNAAAAVANSTAVSGAFGASTQGAGQTFAIELDTGGSVFTLFSETNGVTAAADIDNAVSVNAAALTAAGYSTAGTAAAGTLVISRTDGQSFDINVTNDAASGGFAGADFATGSNTVNNGSVATSDNAFQLSVGGIVLFNEAGTVGATVTAAELDAATTTFLANNSQFTTTGSFAGGDIAFIRADGTNFQVTIDSNFTAGAPGVAGAFANAAFTTTTTNGVAQTLDTNPTFSLLLDGNALDLSSGFGSGDFTLTADDVAGIINGVAGFTAINNAGVLSITKDDGSNFTLAATGADQVDGVEGLDVGAATTYRGSVTVTSSLELTIGGTAPGDAGLTAGAATAGTVAYGAVNVSTAADADTVLRVVDLALSNVNGARANLGAIQNRFESVIANLQTTSENLSSARSRIRDTDFAAETAELTRNQILQQAGIAMLAQANQAPQSVLSLLR